MTLARIINRGLNFVKYGCTPAQAAKLSLRSPLDVLMVADNLRAPEAHEPGAEWYSVALGDRDAALVAATVTALAALTNALHALCGLSLPAQGASRSARALS